MSEEVPVVVPASTPGPVAEPAPVWPDPIVEDFHDPEWPDLTVSKEEVERWVLTHKKMLIRTVTWNLCAKPPPAKEAMTTTLLPSNK